MCPQDPTAGRSGITQDRKDGSFLLMRLPLGKPGAWGPPRLLQHTAQGPVGPIPGPWTPPAVTCSRTLTALRKSCRNSRCSWLLVLRSDSENETLASLTWPPSFLASAGTGVGTWLRAAECPVQPPRPGRMTSQGWPEPRKEDLDLLP